ncbi:MAG TPA: SDR family oxidoreductase [Gaiellaceae bacterium]|nr:SDR family oxidoreductase [Gaiellaceae bacterium]
MSDTALVCGASGALGQSLVAAFLERGDRVIAVERQLVADPPPGVRSEAVDLTVPDEVEALWERLDEPPRWVVNAVGGFRGGTVAETEPDAFRFLVDLNLATTLWSCRAAARRLAPGSAIVNVASRSALVGGSGSAVYSVTKAAVVRLTEVLADELAGKRIRVNAILPSVIDTPANRAAMSAAALSDAVPPAQIAAVAGFLSSDAAAAVSGAVLPVYGWA